MGPAGVLLQNAVTTEDTVQALTESGRIQDDLKHSLIYTVAILQPSVHR